MEVPGMALPPTIWFSPKNVWYGGGRGSLLFGSNVYSVRFCMPTYLGCQGVGWNILRKIHAYFLWVRTKSDSYGGGKKSKVAMVLLLLIFMDV